MKTTLWRRMQWGMLGMLVVVCGSLLLTGNTVCAVEGAPIQVSVGEAVVVPAEKYETLAIADPAVADVLKLSDKEISVIGKKAGVTTLTIVYTEGKATALHRITVGHDAAAATIVEMSGKQPISVRTIGDTIVLDGHVTDELQAARAAQVATAYKDKVINLIEVRKPRQVRISTRVAEVQTEAITAIGFRWFGVAGDVRYAMDFAALPQGPGSIAQGITPPLSAGGSGTTSPLSLDSSMDVVLQLLVTKNLARILSQPTLLTLSGKEAYFLVGQEIPIVQQLPQSFTVEFKNVGVIMRIKPTVDSQNQINTTVHSEVSQVIGAGSFGVPIIGSKQADTTMQLKDGQTIVIGGLLENNINRDFLRKVPWLAEIPIFGYLFRQKEFQQAQREVLFFLKTEIVKDPEVDVATAAKTPAMQDWNKAWDKELLDKPKPDWQDDFEKRIHEPKAVPATEKPAPPPSSPTEPTTNFTPARPAGP